MALVQIVWFYILWHYTKAWQDIFRIIGNYLWFVGNYFSINLLMQTLFSPWRRLSVAGGKGTSDTYLGALLVNSFMRLVGFFVRLVTIIVGAIALLFTITLACAFVIAWLFLPIIAFFLFFAGLGQILRSFF